MSTGLRLAVLASGTGSNLQALIDRVHGRDGIEIVAVGSDKADARALERAAGAGIQTRVFAASDFSGGRPERDAALADWLASLGVELVVLAGYMQIMGAEFLDAFPGSVINVHPSLLPAFTGIRAVQQALDYGVKVFGVTVHFVDGGVDTGPIILQEAVALPDAREPDDVFAALHPIEHRLLPEAVCLFAQRRIWVDPENERRIRVTET